MIRALAVDKPLRGIVIDEANLALAADGADPKAAEAKEALAQLTQLTKDRDRRKSRTGRGVPTVFAHTFGRFHCC